LLFQSSVEQFFRDKKITVRNSIFRYVCVSHTNINNSVSIDVKHSYWKFYVYFAHVYWLMLRIYLIDVIALSIYTDTINLTNKYHTNKFTLINAYIRFKY